MIGYPAVEDLAPAEFHHDEYIEDTELGRDHGKEISGNDDLVVVAYEGQPPLSWIATVTVFATHVLEHGAGCDANSRVSVFSSLAIRSSLQVTFPPP